MAEDRRGLQGAGYVQRQGSECMLLACDEGIDKDFM